MLKKEMIHAKVLYFHNKNVLTSQNQRLRQAVRASTLDAASVYYKLRRNLELKNFPSSQDKQFEPLSLSELFNEFLIVLILLLDLKDESCNSHQQQSTGFKVFQKDERILEKLCADFEKLESKVLNLIEYSKASTH